MDRTLSAPGKLFVTGEYAVLWGGEARVLAVGPRVNAHVRQRSDRVVELVLEGGRLVGDATPLGVRWNELPSPEFHFVARTVDLALRAVSKEVAGFSIAFASSPLWNGRKLGLGSSARATVLASEAVRWALSADFDALKLALTAHAEAQGGKGSGGDVAASFAGGLTKYRRWDVAASLEASRKGGLGSALRQAPAVEIARLPPPRFPTIFAFSGESASTTSLVKQIEATWTPAQRATFVQQSDALGHSLEQALARGDFTVLREACAELQALLFSLGPTRAESLERILGIASSWDCAGKQSGAGGGDGCLLFAPDETTAGHLLEALAARGFYALRVSGEDGLRGEPTDAKLVGWL